MIGARSGKAQKDLRDVAGVSQSEEFIDDSDVLLNLLNESGTVGRKLELDGLPYGINSRLAYPAMPLKTLHGVDGGDLRDTECRSDLTDLALRMPVKEEQHAGLERREPQRVQAVAEETMQTEDGFEAGELPRRLKRFHKRSIADVRRMRKERSRFSKFLVTHQISRASMPSASSLVSFVPISTIHPT